MRKETELNGLALQTLFCLDTTGCSWAYLEVKCSLGGVSHHHCICKLLMYEYNNSKGAALLLYRPQHGPCIH